MAFRKETKPEEIEIKERFEYLETKKRIECLKQESCYFICIPNSKEDKVICLACGMFIEDI